MRFSVLFAAFVLAGCSDTSIKTVNSSPEAIIASHSTGDTVLEGDTETVIGQVGDTDHALEDLSVTWLQDGEAVCTDSAPDSTGNVLCPMTFAAGGGEVSLMVRDPRGAADSASVSLDVQATDAPTAELISPTADGIYYSDELIAFQGRVSDTEDSVDALTISFETDADGDLGLELNVTSEGEVEAFGQLPEGEHAVRIKVVDSTGKDDMDSAVITVGPPNSAPTCTITSPEDSSTGPEGEEVRFEGTVDDVDVSPDWLSVEWESDKDGSMGSSSPDSDGTVGIAISTLSAQTHRVTLMATDEVGSTCTDSIYYTVGTPPVLNVTAPSDGGVLDHSEAVVFEATVEDNEDLPDAVGLSWESDIDGVFSTDGADSTGAVTVSVDSLSPGDHVVTVTATDTAGLVATDTVSFNLNQPPTAPTVTLEPDPATTDQTLIATATGSVDPEATATVTYTYAWFEDGLASFESTADTFPASATAKHRTYRVEVTATDGLVESTAGDAEATVVNSDPVLSGPTLSADEVAVGDVLTCTATATDIDPEDSPTVTYEWSDGSTGPTYTVTADDTVDSAITCTATADDSDGGTATGTASATVTNTAPIIDGVTISPDPAYNDDTLICTATATDADGDAPTMSYEWTGGATGPELPLTSIIAASGDSLTCTATATDADGGTASDTATVTIGNRAPTVDVSIDPAAPTRHDTLTCTASGITDPDDDATTISLAWTIDGAPAVASSSETESILEEAADAGQTVVCTATVDDGKGGIATATATVVITNTAPVVDSVTLSPENVYTNDTITAAVTTSDEDGDALTVAYAWYVDGSIVGESGSTISGATYFDKDDAVHVVVTPSDGTDSGDSVASDSITISNTAPSAPSVSIGPVEPIAGVDDIICSIDSGSSDADGDTVSYTITWDVDGTAFTGATTTTRTGDTISADETNGDEEWTCTVTPNDGDDDGTAGTASVTVQDCFEGWASTTNELSAADYSFVGEEADDWAGYFVSSAGDVDGDGFGDILVGANRNDDGGNRAGKAYLILGASLGSSGTIDLSAADYSFVGENADDFAGVSVSSAGDVDGDGLADLLVGAYGNDDGGTAAGKVYLILGASLGSDSTIELSSADYSFVGENLGDGAGRSISSAGDVDGDGLDDILVGAYSNDDGAINAGKTYLILGASLGSDSTIELSSADYNFVGENPGDYAGWSVSSSGDVDGDGLADLFVGAIYNDDGGDNAGKAYLILGASLGSDSTIELSSADYSFVGENGGDYACSSVSSAGDVDGDGLADLLVGAWRNDGGSSFGKAYLILGASLGDSSSIDLSEADYSFVGEESDARAGHSVSSAGDVDGDGLADLIVGAPAHNGGAINTGKAYLILGASLGSISTIDLSSADYSFVGEGAEDYAGVSVSSAGDVNGDGLDDLFVGAMNNDDGGLNAGKTYLVLSPNVCNTPPHGTEVSIAPASPIAAEDDLVCTIDTEAFDAEDDTITYTFEWEVDGIAYESTDSTTHTGDTIPASATAESEEWTCTVTPFDGTEDGPPASDSVTVQGCFAGWHSAELSLLDSSYKLYGEEAGDTSGYSVASAGDVNGDGIDDVLIGAYNESSGGEAAGAAYLIFGSTMLDTRPIDLADADYKFMGEPHSDSARSVASAGDVDGDGFDDLLIGSPSGFDAAYVVLSASLGSSRELTLSSDADYILRAEAGGHQAGDSVASAGDVDGDGLADILVGAPNETSGGSVAGASYLVLGSSLGGTREISLADADYKFIGDSEYDYSGDGVASAGDVDDDGLDDILIGAPGDKTAVDYGAGSGGASAGAVHIILGASLGAESEINLSEADYKLVAIHESGQLGGSLASAGDVDGDGRSDILIGTTGSVVYESYLVLGSSLGLTTEIHLMDADVIFTGEGDRAGFSVDGAGDVDGDGLDDLLIGAYGETSIDDYKGSAYLVLAATLWDAGTTTFSLSDADYRFVGENPGDRAGMSVAGAGDINGDGLADVLVGAIHEGTGGSVAGATYALLAPNACNTPPRGTAVSITASGTDSELVCVIDTEAFDAEDDLISYSFEWTVDGEPFTDTDSTTHSGDTVDGASTTEGEEWACTVTPNDGDAWGAPTTASHVVLDCDEDGDGLLALACGGGDCDDTDFDTGVCWSSVGPGAIHSCGLRTDGEVLCWGDNTYEQSSPPSDSFTMVETRGYGDSSHSCGLTVDGTVECWGSDSYGESSPPDTPFQSVSVGRRHTCALTLSGNAVCWGDNTSGQSTPPSTTFTSLNAGESHNCAVTASGLVECWGYNASGQSTPPEGTFQSVSAGDNHTCGLATDNSVLCWGANGFGETSPPSGSFVAVTAGGYFSCALNEAGDAQCWGADHHGQASPPDTTFESIRGGGWHTCATTPSGDIECWGANDSGQSTPPEL